MPLNLPNILTWLRMLAIPLLVAIYLPARGTGWHAGAQPGRDGDLHRRPRSPTGSTATSRAGSASRRPFGAFLDPVADKLMVAAPLIMLLELDRVGALVASIIIGREIAISALREWMATMGARKSVAVNSLGKFKTVCADGGHPVAALRRRAVRLPAHRHATASGPG